MNDLEFLLQNNPYPGRGIIIGCSEDNSRIVVLYFIMGRSENSRNRIFEKTPYGIRTKAYDPSKMTDPSLVIYNPVRISDKRLIVSNGDQTDTIFDHLSKGSNFFTALSTREYEPDLPIFTPRISGLIEPDGSYKLSILKKADNDSNCCLRSFFEYSVPVPGIGHFISVYQTDGDPPPSFSGEPVTIKIDLSGGFLLFIKKVWNSMDYNNKVALYAKTLPLDGSEPEEIIINKLNN